jgi:hypothetical protein
MAKVNIGFILELAAVSNLASATRLEETFAIFPKFTRQIHLSKEVILTTLVNLPYFWKKRKHWVEFKEVDVMMTIFCNLQQLSSKKLAYLLKTIVMINFLHNFALFCVKNAKFFAIFSAKIFFKIKTSVTSHTEPEECNRVGLFQKVHKATFVAMA